MEYFAVQCAEHLARGFGPALLLYAGVVCIRCVRGGEIAFDPSMLWGFFWTWWLVTLLRATGFTGLGNGWRWSIFQPLRFGMGFSGNGLFRELVLALLMYAPCVFLTPYALKETRWNGFRTIALGGVICFLTQMLQLPAGGCLELGSLIFSAAGTAAGYFLNNRVEALARRPRGADAH